MCFTSFIGLTGFIGFSDFLVFISFNDHMSLRSLRSFPLVLVMVRSRYDLSLDFRFSPVCSKLKLSTGLKLSANPADP